MLDDCMCRVGLKVRGGPAIKQKHFTADKVTNSLSSRIGFCQCQRVSAIYLLKDSGNMSDNVFFDCVDGFM